MNEKIKEIIEKVDQDYIKTNKDFYDCLMKMDHKTLAICCMRIANENNCLKEAIKYALELKRFEILTFVLDSFGEVENGTRKDL